MSQAAQLGWWLSWEDTQGIQFLGMGAKFKDWCSSRGGKAQDKAHHCRHSQPRWGDRGVPSAHCRSTAVQPRDTGLLPGCTEMDLGHSGQRVCRPVFKGAGGRAEASMGATGEAAVGSAALCSGPKPALWTAVCMLVVMMSQPGDSLYGLGVC